ncbi:kinase-like domain-containing protein [Fimicolochytrium jonesii]|uniref:kinase-like domain-containing protein n=1 Tax=Fimicolochytrium jonesii TaxID=1396493 RepID=UPI0022FF1D78|nr:kinase-like domain-containing protein [Fimicolochytrium jonesii]KAI8819857.1 kinase-like domain-containing protein [Fimicolochytrium jonesii]
MQAVGEMMSHMNVDTTPPSSAPSSPKPSPPTSRPASSRSKRNSGIEGGIKETLNAVLKESEDGSRTLNQYVLMQTLGRGAYGTVYYGLDTTDPANPEPVAIKEFSKQKLRRQKLQREGGAFGARGRFRGRGRGAAATQRADALSRSDNPIDLVRGEIAIFKKLDHPNVISLFEVLDDPEQHRSGFCHHRIDVRTAFSAQDSLWMVFELCSRGAILDVSTEKAVQPLSEAESRRLFRQMILGIEYLHDHDIAHRDIKPDNMLLAEDGTLKIVDFGVSEMFDPANDKVKTSAGSPAFSAPEVCAPHNGNHSARACDVWAMGVTLYCILFGKLPFHGASIVDLFETIMKDEPEIPSSTNPAESDILHRLLEKDPEKRITIEQLRSHPWVTEDGRDPLPGKQEIGVPVPDITEEDIVLAVKGVRPLFTVLKAVAKMKMRRLASRSSSTDDTGPANGTGDLVR